MDFIIFIVLSFILFFIVKLLLTSKKKVEEFKPLKLSTLVECKSCKNFQTRNYKDGDYLYQHSGECKCGGQLWITKIYNVEETEKEQKWRQYTERFAV